ncbi:hypothetical protein V6N13_024678 [Hibiscus sabdariffa]|uniref:Uncharacterized protein n=2 Tax=Hibiscus sabdariffa TaxID=183260 RepID=A0ABR1ZJM9_9ROSI
MWCGVVWCGVVGWKSAIFLHRSSHFSASNPKVLLSLAYRLNFPHRESTIFTTIFLPFGLDWMLLLSVVTENCFLLAVGKESDFLFRNSGQLGSYQSEDKKERQILFSDFGFREIATFVGL